MSIHSAMAANDGERVRKEWLNDLRVAYESRDWQLVSDLIAKMNEYYFSE